MSYATHIGQTVAAARAAWAASGYADGCSGGFVNMGPGGEDAIITAEQMVACVGMKVRTGCSGDPVDVTSTFAWEDWGDGWPSGNFTYSHWFAWSGSTRVCCGYPDNAALISGSLPNDRALYSFGGTWTAGTTYAVGYSYKSVDGDMPVRLGLTTHLGGDSWAESVTETLPQTSVWTYHETSWTPTSTYVSSSLYSDNGIKIMFGDGTTVTNQEFQIDPGPVTACTPEPL